MKLKQSIKVGSLVWVEQCRKRALPEGLTDGVQVRVLARMSETMVKVQTEDGRVFDLDPIHVDTGWLFILGGKRFSEGTARAKAHIRKLIAEAVRNTNPRYPDLMGEQVVLWRSVLARNGVEAQA